MSATARLMAFVKDRPGQWIHATTFEQFGRQGWRTRISNARQKFQAVQDGTIENQVLPIRDASGTIVRKDSFYRYVPAETPPRMSGHNVNAPTEGRLI